MVAKVQLIFKIPNNRYDFLKEKVKNVAFAYFLGKISNRIKQILY